MLTLLAQTVNQPGLTNPAVKDLPVAHGDSGQVGAEILGKYIAIILTTAVAFGGLAVLIYFVLGAINWITAGGDKGKIEKAQQRIIQAFIGFALLVFSVTILQWIGPTLFGIDLLKVEFINQLSEGSSGYHESADPTSDDPRINQPEWQREWDGKNDTRNLAPSLP